jgi:FkbM family methyltransferase
MKRAFRKITRYLENRFGLPIMAQGHRMFLHPSIHDPGVSRQLLRYGDFEHHITEIVTRVVKEGDVAVDVGAQIGFFTLLLAKKVGPKGKVFGFEPDPDNFDLLKKNLTINAYNNVTLEQKACADQTGRGRLYLSKNDKGDGRIYDNLKGYGSLEIETITLDDYFAVHQANIDFIKIDAQGAEKRILQGMTKLLSGNKELKMVIEFQPELMRNLGSNEPAEFLRLLSDYGFRIVDLNNSACPAEADKLLAKYASGNPTDLFCQRDPV